MQHFSLMARKKSIGCSVAMLKVSMILAGIIVQQPVSNVNTKEGRI
jgi:hypothetical protein